MRAATISFTELHVQLLIRVQLLNPVYAMHAFNINDIILTQLHVHVTCNEYITWTDYGQRMPIGVYIMYVSSD